MEVGLYTQWNLRAVPEEGRGGRLFFPGVWDAILARQNATLVGCHIYGISSWNVNLVGAKQENLVITTPKEPTITVDHLQVAQFIYLLLNNKEIREAIDTITSKVVVILGRFKQERKAILDAIREGLRQRTYSPVLFDFDKPKSRDLTETVSTLLHMARFLIADLTDPRSIPQELMKIVEGLPSVPVQPLLLKGKKEWAMFEHFRRYPWVRGIMSTSPRSGYGILSAESLPASELLPLIDDMTLDEQIIVVGKLRAIEIILLERIMHLDQWHPHHRILSTDHAILTAVTERPNGDELLDAKEAARRMGYSPRWLYKNADSLPFTIRQKSGRLRFSKHGLENYLRNHPKKF